MRLDIAGFLGSITQINKALLPDGIGVSSVNQAPGRGDFNSWREPKQVATLPVLTPRKTIHRMGRDLASDALYWLSWPTVVHAVRGFDREDTHERTYFTGATGGPAWTDQTMAIASAPYPTATRPLGVPAPTQAPTLGVNTPGVNETKEDRFYCTTFVNDLGWESAPSPPARVTCNADAKINVSGLEDAPAGNYGINRRRIYRTKSGASGSTEFFFAKELVYASGQSWVEAGEPMSNDVLPTQTTLGGWLPCPSDAKCLTQLWNEMAAVISGKAVRPCVAGHIYAYPYDYEILIAEQPVALATWGQNLLVLTTGSKPSMITGQDPASLSEMPIDGLNFNAACQSETSVVNYTHGASWAGPDGLCYLGNSGQKVLTGGLIHPDDWKKMRPSTMVGTQYMGMAVMFYDDGTGYKGFMVDPISPNGIFWLSKGYPAAYSDPKTSSLYVLDGTTIKKWDASDAFMTASFVSKSYRTPTTNMGYGRVLADAYPVTVELYADGKMVISKQVEDDEVFSMPDGYEARQWQVGIKTAGKPVVSVHIAESAEELFE